MGEERLATMSTDMKNYYGAANAIASSFDFSHWGTIVFGPGYPSFLALIGAPFEMSPFAMILVQVLVSSFSAVMLAILAKQVTGSPKIGIVVGLINASSLLAVELSCYMWSETLFFALITAAVLTQVLGHKNQSMMAFVVSGLLLATAALTRSVGLLFFLVVVPSIFLICGSNSPPKPLLTWKRLRGPVITVLITVSLTGLWIGHNYSCYGVGHVALSAPHGMSEAVIRIRSEVRGISYEDAGAAFASEVQQHRLIPQGFPCALATHARESFFDLLVNEPLACIRVLSQNAFKMMTVDTTTDGPPAKMPIMRSVSPFLKLGGMNYRSLLLMLLGTAWLWRAKKYRLLGFLAVVVLYFASLGAFAFNQGSRISYPAQVAGSILMAYPIAALYTLLGNNMAIWRHH